MSLTDTVLAHHGVLGMTWGHHKGVDSGGGGRSAKKVAKGDKKFEKTASKSSTFFAVYNDAAKRMNNTEIDRINNSPKYKGKDLTKNPTLQKAYYKEYADTFTKMLNASSDAHLGTNASGTKRVNYSYDAASGDINFHLQEIKHADALPHFIGKVDSKGFITSVRTSEQEKVLKQSEAGAAFLEHHGVKGQKWGIRRNNPSGGGATEVVARTRPGKTVKVSGGKKLPAHADAIQAAVARQKAKKSSTDSLSTKELQDLVLRMNMEQQYRQLVAKNSSQSNAKKTIDQILAAGNTVNKVQSFVNSPAGKALRIALKAKLAAR